MSRRGAVTKKRGADPEPLPCPLAAYLAPARLTAGSRRRLNSATRPPSSSPRVGGREGGPGPVPPRLLSCFCWLELLREAFPRAGWQAYRRLTDGRAQFGF